MNQLKQLKLRFLTLVSMLLISACAVAQSTLTDTVCAGSQDVLYGVSSSSPGSTFDWSLSPASGGTIDNSITASDSAIQIDWNMTSGTYELSVVEINANGCAGDTVSLDIIIEDLPSITSIEGDSVCAGSPSEMILTFSGDGPWIVDYTDGINNYQITATNNPQTVSLPAYNSDTEIEITGLSDSRSCNASTGSLPSVDIIIYSRPVTAPIYHY